VAAPKRIVSRLAEMRDNPSNVRLSDALAVARHFFGEPRRAGSHLVFKMPWAGENLQDAGNGRAKAYQIKQLLAAVEKCMESDDA
jgi:hypothetical protein